MTEEPEDLQCSACEAVFTVIWHYNPEIQSVEYCPFCGEEMKNFGLNSIGKEGI